MLLWKEYVGSYFPQEMPELQVSIGSSQPQVYFMKNSTTGIYRYISIGSSQPQVYFMKTVLQVYADIHRKFTATLYEI